MSMNVVVPLAGPGYVINGEIKGLIDFRSEPLLKYILCSRPWHKLVSNYTFVLLDTPLLRSFAFNYLKKWFINSNIIYISTFTNGAALTALIGTCIHTDPRDCLIIDLADIYYECSIDIDSYFSNDDQLAGLALTFNSSKDQYSYLSSVKNSRYVQFAAEKDVISHHASAGTYIYKNSLVYFESLLATLKDPNHKCYMHNDLVYVCPIFNGAISSNYSVMMHSVHNVIDIK